MDFESLITILPCAIALILLGISRYFKIPLIKLAFGYTVLLIVLGSISFYFLNGFSSKLIEENKSNALGAGLILIVPLAFIVIHGIVFWIALIGMFIIGYFGRPMLRAAFYFFTYNGIENKTENKTEYKQE